MIKTWRVQWRIRSDRYEPQRLLEWKDIEGEEWGDEHTADVRKSQYWEKLSLAYLMEFRVMESKNNEPSHELTQEIMELVADDLKSEQI